MEKTWSNIQQRFNYKIQENFTLPPQHKTLSRRQKIIDSSTKSMNFQPNNCFMNYNHFLALQRFCLRFSLSVRTVKYP